MHIITMDSDIHIACIPRVYNAPSGIQSITIFCSVAELVKFMVALATVAVVVVMATNALVWAEAIVGMLAEELVIDVVAAVEIALEFSVAVPHSADVLEDVLTDVTIGVLPDIGVGGLTDVNVGIFSVVMTVLEFIMSTPLGEFSC